MRKDYYESLLLNFQIRKQNGCINVIKKSKYIISTVVLFVLLIFGSGAKDISAQQLMLNSRAMAEGELHEDPYRSQFFRVNGAPSITVHTISGDIEVIQNPSINGVQIDIFAKQSFSLWSGSQSLDNYRVILQQNGTNIIASVEDKRSGRNYRSDSGVQFSFVVQVPAKASVNLRSADGDISATGISGKHYIQNHSGELNLKNIDGEIRAVSTSGNVVIDNVNGLLFSKTVSGDFNIKNSTGEMRTRTVSGSIFASNIGGVLVAATTSGDIFSDFYSISEGIYLKSTTGNVEVLLPKGPGYSITAEAMDFNFKQLDTTNSDISVQFRNASVIIREGGIPVNVSTVAGTVTVRESD